MNLYRWPISKALERYSSGEIIVMAESLDDARRKAKEQMPLWLLGEHEYWFNSAGIIDEYYWKDYKAFEQKFEQDIMAEAVIVPGAVVFIRGSE